MYPNFALLFLMNSNHEILLLRRINTPFCNHCYCVPGGEIAAHEPASKAIIREAQSSLGISLKEDEIQCVHVMHRKCNEPEFFACVFKPTIWNGTPAINQAEKYDDLQWFALDALPTNIVAAHLHAIQQIQQGKTYSEHGWDLYVDK
jgi:ADP-ribose pyrophosphatase YjhB (NUDIX family)